jgi:hypothetical protein
LDYFSQETREHTNRALAKLGINVPPGIRDSIAAGSPQSNMRADSTIDPETLAARRAVAKLTVNFVQRQKELLGEKREPSWFENNQAWLTPLLTGVATMASSPSRYLGSALLQGLGGAASSFGNVQSQISARRLQEQQAMQAAGAGIRDISGGVSSLANAGMANSQIQQNLANTGATALDAAGRATMVAPNATKVKAETGLIGEQTEVAKAEKGNIESRTAQTTALTQPMVNEMLAKTSQLLSQGVLTEEQAKEVRAKISGMNSEMIRTSIFQPPGGPLMTILEDGTVIPFSKWIEQGRPPLKGESTIRAPAPGTATPGTATPGAPVPGTATPGAPTPGTTTTNASTPENRVTTTAKNPNDYTYTAGIGKNGSSMQQEEIARLNSGAVNTNEARQSANKISEEIQQDAKNAAFEKPKILELAQNLIRDGFLASGAGINQRTDIVSLAQTFANVLGLGQIDRNLAPAQISEKLITQLVGQQTAALGQRAQSALVTLAKGFAQQNMSPAALRELLADALIENQKNIDLNAYTPKYQQSADQYPGIGTRVREAFNNDYNGDFWRNEKHKLIKLMEFPTVPNGKNSANPYYKVSPFQHIMGDPRSKAITPEDTSAGNTYQEIYNPNFVETYYGPGIYRYFSGRSR